MELTGTITKIMEEQQGMGKNGQWRKKEFVVQLDGPYAKLACFVLWNNRIDQFPLELNKYVKVYFDVESREYNGRFYTDLLVWKIEYPTIESPEINKQDDFNFTSLNPNLHDDLPF